MYQRPFALTVQATGPFDELLVRVKAALQTEGFGVLSEIDVQATLRSRLGVERKPYVILGACNPPLAHRALEVEPPIGLFLPCNVDVFEGEDGTLWVQTPRPIELFALVQKPELAPIAEEVQARLERALAKLG